MIKLYLCTVLCISEINNNDDMIDKINQLLQEVEALKAANAEELEALRIKFLSKKGAINDLMADFRNVAAEQKKEVGMRLNELKNKAQEKINALKEQFESQDTGCDDIDLTRSAYPVELGTRHPLTIVKTKSSIYLHVWVSVLPKVRKLRMTGTCSPH